MWTSGAAVNIQWRFHPLLFWYCSERNIKCIYSAHTGRSESCDCNFNIFAKFPLVAASIISVPWAASCVWHSAVTLTVSAEDRRSLYRPHNPRTQFSFSYHPNSPRGFFLTRVCDECLGDAAASFSRRDIYAAAGFYMCVCCCDIYSVSF